MRPPPDPAVNDPSDIHGTDFTERVRFVCTLATRLHQFGTSAPRLESAISEVAQRLGLSTHVWCNPTGMIISFAERGPVDDRLSELTQVLRLAPGENDLRRLAIVDRIAEDVGAGKLGIADGYRQLRELDRPPRWGSRLLRAVAHGVSAGAVAVLFGLSGADVGVSALNGLAIGMLGLLAARNAHFAAGYEAMAALMAALFTAWYSAQIEPLAVNTVLVSSLIVLLPGMMLTTAVNELAVQHLVAGMSRFAGAVAVLLKLVFGTAAGLQVAVVLGFPHEVAVALPAPEWVMWLAVVVASFNFAILFKAAYRDFPLVMASAATGFLMARWFGIHYGAEFAAFAAGLVVGVLANLYARLAGRPGAIVRVPGIIMLVPGSTGFRSLFLAIQGDVSKGLDVAFALLLLLIALVAGLLFANVLVTPRRTLS
jgi:uncharacterized membrane protein YjjP (DUF1212 family)